MADPFPRLAVRAVLIHRDRLLLVNAFPGQQSDLWCLPGGGVQRHASLHDNLIREVFEETGLTVTVGDPVLVNEFHDPDAAFHQVEIFFRCALAQGETRADWRDPEGVVNRHLWATRDRIATLRVKPDSLPLLAWGPPGTVIYDPLERLVR